MMRALALLILLASTPAAANPELFGSWDMHPRRSATFRTGIATLHGVTEPRPGYVVILEAIRTTWAPRPWVEIGAGGHVAGFSGRGAGGAGPTLDVGFGIPNLHVGFVGKLSPRWRLGGLARTSIGATEKGGATSPADFASGAFLLDESITWSQAWTWTAHLDAQWSDGETTVQGGAGLTIYYGRALPHAQTVLRLGAGAATKLDRCWTGSGELLLLTDVLDEGYTEPYDIVPVATIGVHHEGRWRLGGALSYGWVAAASGVGRPGLVAVFDATRKL
jgi:hypothetical protein